MTVAAFFNEAAREAAARMEHALSDHRLPSGARTSWANLTPFQVDQFQRRADHILNAAIEAQYTDAASGAHHYIHWPRERFCWFRDVPLARQEPTGEEGPSMSGSHLIAAERQRQIEREGWTPEHDDTHSEGELAQAAVLYARPPLGSGWRASAPAGWPFETTAWKPRGQIANLIRAGALIAAEIDRLQRRLEDFHGQREEDHQ